MNTFFNHQKGIIMQSSFALSLTATFIGFAALFSANAAHSNDLSCTDLSFNTPGCAAHIKSTKQVPTNNPVQRNAQSMVCSDWSFNVPGCSAYIKSTNQALADFSAQSKTQMMGCSDWSFNTPGCTAHIN